MIACSRNGEAISRSHIGRGIRQFARHGMCLTALVCFGGVGSAQAATFSFTGGEQAYVVPSGVTEVAIDAVGAPGGIGCLSTAGGLGGEVSADFAVSSGSVLYVEVGGPGTSAFIGGFCTNGSSAGGFDGGGAGSAVGGGGGGGASEVQSVPFAAPDSAGSRLIVAGGGGGGGSISAGGGDAGSTAPGAGGGGGGTRSAAGAAGNSSSCSTGATSGAFAVGGTGGSDSPQNGGGGGGGGYWGGGGGGCTAPQNGWGGGGGSSYVALSAIDASSPTTSAAAPSVTVTPLVAKLSYSPSDGLSFPGTQADGTISSPLTLAITDTGSGPLQISSLTFAGADAQDFPDQLKRLHGADRSRGELLAERELCSAGAGSAHRDATDCRQRPYQPRQRGLVRDRWAAADRPDRPARTNRPDRCPGPDRCDGCDRCRGPGGKVELVTCKTVTKTAKGHKRKVQKCTGKLVSGTVKFTTKGAAGRARISRGRTVFATGAIVSMGDGRSQLMLSARRPLQRGRYTLSVRTRYGRRWITHRSQVTIA